MEKRKLVLTIIGIVILAMAIMVYIYFSKPGRDELENVTPGSEEYPVNAIQSCIRRPKRSE